MISTLLNSAFAWYVRRAMRPCHVYPPARTAVLLVDVQNAFVGDSPALVRQLGALADWARQQRFLVIHAPTAAGAALRFPVPAQREMQRRLAAAAEAPALAAAVGPQPADITLPARPTLSAFATPALDELIAARGIEHLILAGPLADLTVDSTLRDAVQRDLHATVVADCVSASSQAALQLELRYTMPRYAHLVTDLAGLAKRA